MRIADRPALAANRVQTDAGQRLLAATSLTLAHLARGAPLVQTLTCILNGVEGELPGVSGAILLVDAAAKRLKVGAAPSLNKGYCRAIDGLATDAGAWPQQATADSPIRLADENIAEDRFWRRLRDLALQRGLHACMTVPIRSSTNAALGFFIGYSTDADRASDERRPVIADAVAFASIAIERDFDSARTRQLEDALRAGETRMSLAVDRSGTGIWDRNVTTGEIHYSAGWKAILGYADSEITHRIEDSYPRVHPEDLASVQRAIQEHFDQKTRHLCGGTPNPLQGRQL